MTNALAFLLLGSWRNRVRLRLRRVREPRYLVSALAGLAYLGFVFFGTGFFGSPGAGGPPRGEAESGLSLLLLVVVLLQCLSFKPVPPLFDEAEVQFLFPAPAGHAALILYRLARAQSGILFGTLLTFVFIARRPMLHPGFLFVSIWGLFNFLFLFRTAVGAARRKWPLRLGAGFVLLAVGLSILGRMRGSLETPAAAGFRLAALLESGPASWILSPFRMLVRPALALGWGEFLPALAPLAALCLLLVAGLIRSRAIFEASALGHPATASGRAREKGKRAASGGRRLEPFPLPPAGGAFAALYWKNLFAAGVAGWRWTPFILAALAALVILVARALGPSAMGIAGSVAAALAGFLVLMGPILFGEDLRMDLRNVELLKSYPMTGRQIVLGEVLAPATLLTALQWPLVLVAAFLLRGGEGVDWPTADRVFWASGAFLILPCLGLIGVLGQNAAVLLLPGWVHAGKDQGVEAMGQRLIASILTVLLLAVAAAPAAAVFAALFFPGHRVLGSAAVPLASLGAVLILLGETTLGVRWLGRRFERFDPAAERIPGF